MKYVHVECAALPSAAPAFPWCTKGRCRWGQAAEQNIPSHHYSALSFDPGKNLVLLPQSWSYLLLLLIGVGDGNSHPGRAKLSVLTCFSLSFNQILTGYSHFTTHRQYLAETKKVNLSCFHERNNKDWSPCVKARRQNNSNNNSNNYNYYNCYLQILHNSDLPG